MKKIVLLFLTTLILSSFKTGENNNFNIVGKWESVTKDGTSSFIFDKDGYAYFDFKGLKLGGKEFTIKDRKANLKYEIDNSTSPMKIDFIVTFFDDNETKRLLCIAKKIENNKLVFAVGFNGERPKIFEEKNEMIFKRVKE